MRNLFYQFCIWVKVSAVFNWFWLIHHKNYAILSYSNLKLIAYTAYGRLHKIITLTVRHLTRSHFLESCGHDGTQKMNFSIKYFFSKCDKIRRKLHFWSHLLKKSLLKNFIFCAVRRSILLRKRGNLETT